MKTWIGGTKNVDSGGQSLCLSIPDPCLVCTHFSHLFWNFIDLIKNKENKYTYIYPIPDRDVASKTAGFGDQKNEQIHRPVFFFPHHSTSYVIRQRQCVACWKSTSCCLTNFLLVYSQVQLLCFILDSCLQDVTLTHVTFLCWLPVSPTISC